MNTYDSLLLFVCALGAGFDLYDGHAARGAFGVFACVAFAIVASVKR